VTGSDQPSREQGPSPGLEGETLSEFVGASVRVSVERRASSYPRRSSLDSVLSKEQRESSQIMLVCVSGGKSDVLDLDL
jgi:hypothetical protein